MILRLPDGYETEIGQAGSFLSGGQRQRIALARALYNKPRLIVLDEPNANLDSEGEMSLLKALERAKEWGATVVVVAHQPYMLRSADKVLYLADGRMRAFGSRDEVMSLAKGAPQQAGRQRTVAAGGPAGALPGAALNEGAK
jgi:ABC-type protease/lipase transport system fused ATPase/permease subunit